MNTIKVITEEDLSKFTVGEPILLTDVENNQVHGVVSEVINTPPPIIPSVIPTELYCTSLDVLNASTVYGNHTALHNITTVYPWNLNAIEATSKPIAGYPNVDLVVNYTVPSGLISLFTMNYRCKANTWRQMQVFVYNFKKVVWERLDYRNLSAAVLDTWLGWGTKETSADYVGANKEVRVRFYVYSTASIIFYLDYARISVK
jgi:hypothetical protein